MSTSLCHGAYLRVVDMVDAKPRLRCARDGCVIYGVDVCCSDYQYQEAAIGVTTTSPKARARGGILGRHGVNVLELLTPPRVCHRSGGAQAKTRSCSCERANHTSPRSHCCTRRPSHRDFSLTRGDAHRAVWRQDHVSRLPPPR
jgi:hypothetical protein